jgi:3-hydroxymyristoyl/3-hydroxydecanoyl-(acyl carrier protein) dehydratase
MMPLPATLLRRSPREAAYALALAPDLPAFQGHFPGSPILPGVVQVDWAMRLGEAAFGPLEPFRGLERVKFLVPIRPLEPLEVVLELRPGRLAFRYQCGAERRASGILLLGAS